MKTRCIFIFTLFLSCMIASQAIASKITFKLETSVTLNEQWVTVNLIVRNIGDEDSLVVHPTLKLGEVSVELEKKPYVAFDGSAQWNHQFQRNTLGILEKGNYPLYITIYYHDSNMYQFTVLEIVSVNFNEIETTNSLNGEFKNLNIDQEGLAELSIKSSFSFPVKGNCKLILPQELSAKLGQKEFIIRNTKPESISFKIHNQTALAGSSYRIYAVIETDIEGQHRTFIFPAIANISQSGKEFQTEGMGSTSLIMGCVIFMGFLFLTALYIELRN